MTSNELIDLALAPGIRPVQFWLLYRMVMDRLVFEEHRLNAASLLWEIDGENIATAKTLLYQVAHSQIL